MEELRPQFEAIRAKAHALVLCVDKDTADRLLGELDALVHNTRQAILDEWNAAFRANFPRRKAQREPAASLESLA